MTTEPLLSAPPLPGGVGISRLRVYDWEGPDGLRGGSPHVHLVCSEAYLVLDGAGAVQTIGPAGFNETPVERGSLLWFTPGLIHRLINHGDLEIIVLMQIATLPEAGDCILSFPDDVLADRQAYLQAAGHDPGRSVGAVDDDAARRRRDLAVVGFNELREGKRSLERFYELAAGIAAPLVPAWRESWETGSHATAEPGGGADRLARGRRRAAAGRRDVRHRPARRRGARTVRAAERVPVGRRRPRDLIGEIAVPRVLYRLRP